MKYVKKPIAIDALQFGTNQNAIWDFTEGNFNFDTHACSYVIETLEGKMKVDVGDYVIKGVQGEFYPCKPDIFDLTYDKV